MESPLMFLPRELVTEILGRLAASSCIDLHTAKLSCKEFLEVAEEDYIHQQISLENLPIIQWHKNSQISKFLDKCVRSRNLEALFRKGVVDYFGGKDVDNALQCLEHASKLGHAEACYAVAIILLFNGGELKKKGIKLLSDMKKSSTQKRRVKHSRRRLQSIIRMIWIKNSMILGQRPICCTIHKRKLATSGWSSDDQSCEDDNVVCDECTCDEEIVPFCNALPQIN